MSKGQTKKKKKKKKKEEEEKKIKQYSMPYFVDPIAAYIV